MPIVFKSGSLNLLEPSGPVQACNGTALLLFNHVEELSNGIKELEIDGIIIQYGRRQGKRLKVYSD